MSWRAYWLIGVYVGLPLLVLLSAVLCVFAFLNWRADR